jgi:hypothetical protein
VVLTVTDRVVESEPSPAPTAASALEPEPTPAAASLGPQPAPPPTFEELEPLVTPVDPAVSHVEDRTEFGFAGHELEPLVVAPAAAAEPQAVAQSAAAEPTPDEPAVVTASTVDDAAGPPPDARANPPASLTRATAAKPLPPPVPGGPLAALKAMSEEERIALFS